MWCILLVDCIRDLWVELHVSVVMLPTRSPIRSNIDFAKAMDGDEEDLCLRTHGLEVLSNAAREWRSAAQVIDVRLSYLVVGLDHHYSVAEVLEAGLERHFDSRVSIDAHALLQWCLKASCLVLKLAGVADKSQPSAQPWLQALVVTAMWHLAERSLA